VLWGEGGGLSLKEFYIRKIHKTKQQQDIKFKKNSNSNLKNAE